MTLTPVRRQALDPAQRFRQREARQSVEEGAYLIEAACQLEADHGAEPGLLLPGKLMLGMRTETREVHCLHGVVAG